jgi:hypothetical protein
MALFEARPQVPRELRLWRWITFELSIAKPHPPPDAAPSPILGLCDKPPFYRIPMDVADLARKLGHIADVAVEPSALEPESDGPVRASDLPKNRRVERSPSCDDALGDALLDPLKRTAKRQVVLWAKDHVGVFGHDDPCEELQAPSLASGGKSVTHEIADRGMAQKRKPPFARESLVANASGNLAAVKVLVVRRERRHP